MEDKTEETKLDLIKRYKAAKKEVGLAEHDFAGLKKKLSQSQEALKHAQANLTAAEESQQSSGLIKVTQIEAARASTQQAKVDYENHNQVVENLELAVQNSETALHDIRGRLYQLKQSICTRLAGEKAREIQEVSACLFEQYSALMLGSGRPASFDPRGVPGDLEFIMARDADLREIQDTIFAKLL